MTNFERWKDEILGIIESEDGNTAVVNGRPMACDDVTSCVDCSFGNNEVSCDALFVKWLYEEVMFDCDESDSEPEDPLEKTSNCENCIYNSKGTDEYPCVECKERYILKFEPKPKEPEMKPCPCCGGKAGMEEISWDWVVECEKCQLSTRAYPTPEEAAKAWNSRKGE